MIVTGFLYLQILLSKYDLVRLNLRSNEHGGNRSPAQNLKRNLQRGVNAILFCSCNRAHYLVFNGSGTVYPR